MKHWFSNLTWKRFSSNNIMFLELHEYADHKFENGINIRICTGRMALTNHTNPYEMNIKFPNGNLRRAPFLSKELLVNKMEELSKLKPEI